MSAHIGGEIVVVGGITYFLFQKIQGQEQRITDLENARKQDKKKIEELERDLKATAIHLNNTNRSMMEILASLVAKGQISGDVIKHNIKASNQISMENNEGARGKRETDKNSRDYKNSDNVEDLEEPEENEERVTEKNRSIRDTRRKNDKNDKKRNKSTKNVTRERSPDKKKKADKNKKPVPEAEEEPEESEEVEEEEIDDEIAAAMDGIPEVVSNRKSSRPNKELSMAEKIQAMSVGRPKDD